MAVRQRHAFLKKILAQTLVTAGMLFLAAGCASVERKLLFYPTHGSPGGPLTPWVVGGETIGYSRVVDSPKAVWLMLPGNGGQASDRSYAIPSFSTEDSVYILEYPGYGLRGGVPSRASFDQAAKEAYSLLRKIYPVIPVCVVGESIGTGAASTLASLTPSPSKIVLIVPFDKLSLVGKDRLPSFVVTLILKDDWDNVAALTGYKGQIDIFGAESDTVIPVKHARALAGALPTSRFVLIPGGHNDWSRTGRVQIVDP
jgi:pimeloyl-ACP methyl ester carboxylesterase